MEHYEQLGVRPTASAAEIRSAYLALARRYHPDRLVDVPLPERERAAARMARINAAWAVLSDRQRRAQYDAAHEQTTSGATVREPGRTWSPFEDGDDPVDPRLLDDTPTGAPTLHRGLTFLPAGLSVVGVAAVVIGFVVGLVPLLGLGLVLLVASGLAFLFIPLVALSRSSRADRIS